MEIYKRKDSLNKRLDSKEIKEEFIRKIKNEKPNQNEIIEVIPDPPYFGPQEIKQQISEQIYELMITFPFFYELKIMNLLELY